MKEQKLEAHTLSKESTTKYENEIRDLSKKVKELSEQVFEMENNQKDDEQKYALAAQEWATKEQKLVQELNMLKELKEDLSQQHTSLKSKYEDEMQHNNQLKEEEFAAS